MADSVTLLQLRTQVRALADSGGSFEADADRYINDTELNDHINASGRLWHGLLVQAIPEMYESSQTLTASPTNLPADHYKTLGVRYQDTNGNTWHLNRVQYKERVNYDEGNTTTQSSGYYLRGSEIYLLPDPSAGTYLHDYVTTWTDLSADGDSFDGYSGWEQWIVFDVVAKARLKEKSELTPVQVERDAIKKEILQMSTDRDLANRAVVQDVRGQTNPLLFDPDFWSIR